MTSHQKAERNSSTLQALRSLLHPYGLWMILATPAFAMTIAILTSSDPTMLQQMIHPSGEFAARFLIVTLMVTPLTIVLRGWRWPQALRRNRRYLGVASFGYGLLHTVLYMIDRAALDPVLSELPKFYIWTGWLAFLIFVPLAITSNNWFVRRMGTWWKWLQRWSYAVAILTLAHWAALYNWGGVTPALVHFVPLIMLEAYRAWYWYLRPAPYPLSEKAILKGR